MSCTRAFASIGAALALLACTTAPPRAAPRAGTVGPEARPARALATAPAVAQLGPAARAALARTPFPMLVLPEEYAARSIVMAEDRWASVAWADRDDEPHFAITLSATDVWHDLGDDTSQVHEVPPSTDMVRGFPATTGTNEGIRFVTWIDGEIAWTLDVHCWDHQHDVRCTEAAFAIDIANALVPAHAAQAPASPGTIGPAPQGEVAP
jgi:hypothetical protein